MLEREGWEREQRREKGEREGKRCGEEDCWWEGPGQEPWDQSAQRDLRRIGMSHMGFEQLVESCVDASFPRLLPASSVL